jgi:recombination protein RecA
VQPEGAGLFPPDLAAAGVALDALVVVHTPREGAGAAVARAAELLLRAGGFGLVVLDLTQGTPRGEAWITRLGALTRREGTRAVLLTTKPNDAPSAGALVAVRVDVRARIESGRYVIDPTVLRDRCHLASRVGPEPCLLPWETPLP